MKHLIIPESDIIALEKARKEYYQSLNQDDVFGYMGTSDLTGRAWHLTHRRYKKLSLWNLILTKIRGN